MGHVREELGLVLARERDLLGLRGEDAARLLGLDLLALEQVVLLGQLDVRELDLGLLRLELLLGDLELRGLLLELGVGVAERVLLRLELGGERLRALQGDADALPRDGRLEGDGDARRDLPQIVDGRVGEGAQRRELEHPGHAPLEHQRRDAEVARRRLAEPRGDADVVLRHVGEEDLLLLEGGLADDALARPEARRERLAVRVGVARDQGEGVGLAVRIDRVERADLRAGVLRELGNDAARQIARVDLPLKDLVQPPDAGDHPLLRVALTLGLARRGDVADRGGHTPEHAALVAVCATREHHLDEPGHAAAQRETHIADPALGERTFMDAARGVGVREQRAELAPDEPLPGQPEAHDRGVRHVGDGAVDVEDEERFGRGLDEAPRVGEALLGVGRGAPRLAHIAQPHERVRRGAVVGGRERAAEEQPAGLAGRPLQGQRDAADRAPRPRALERDGGALRVGEPAGERRPRERRVRHADERGGRFVSVDDLAIGRDEEVRLGARREQPERRRLRPRCRGDRHGLAAQAPEAHQRREREGREHPGPDLRPEHAERRERREAREQAHEQGGHEHGLDSAG